MASALFPPRRTTPWWPYLPATWARATRCCSGVPVCAVRFSFSVFNSEDEADMAIQAVKELAQSK